jgi:Dolichyl-phosphate-mannose-protein mannosyltransferase
MKSLRGTSWLRPEIVLMALFSIIIHLVVRNNLEYHRDELLYFSLGMHPAAGYASVPPLTGWAAWLMKSTFGFSLFAVRLLPALLGGALIMLCAAIAKETGGSRYASFLAGLGLLISIFFMRTYGMFQPVPVEIFLWTLSLYVIIRYLNTNDDKFLLLFGIIAGISLLNKYLAAMLYIGLIAIIPFTPYREVLKKKMFWIGIGAGFLIFLPNFAWQIVRGFPVFHHMSQLYDTQLVHMDYKLFLTEQLLMPFAGSILTIAGLIFLLFGEKIKKFKFLGFLALFVIIGLMLMKGKSYYTLGIFPLLITVGAVSYDYWLRRAWLRIVFPLLLVLLTLPVIPIGLPVFNAAWLVRYFDVIENKYGLQQGRRFEDGSIHSLPQDYADMLGWEEMTSLANKAYQSVGDKKSAIIYCENYGEAGAITVIGKKYGLPQALSFNESFQYWLPEQFVPDIKYLIYINDEPGEDVRALFRKITLTGRVSNRDAREYGTGVYLCEDPAGSFNEFWYARLKELKLAK